MLYYNWQKIFETAERKAGECMRIVKMLVNKEVPYTKQDPIYWYYARKDTFKGSSFILYPDMLLYNAYKYTNRDLCIYLAIASLRPIADYIAYGTLDLDLIKSTLDPREYLDDKNLLPVEDGKIKFIYEQPQVLH